MAISDIHQVYKIMYFYSVCICEESYGCWPLIMHQCWLGSHCVVLVKVKAHQVIMLMAYRSMYHAGI